MDNDRITLRLPDIQLRQIDVFIRAGEFSTRSEVIRTAVKEFIKNYSDQILEKADKIRKVQELGAKVEATTSYTKK